MVLYNFIEFNSNPFNSEVMAETWNWTDEQMDIRTIQSLYSLTLWGIFFFPTPLPLHWHDHWHGARLFKTRAPDKRAYLICLNLYFLTKPYWVNNQGCKNPLDPSRKKWIRASGFAFYVYIAGRVVFKSAYMQGECPFSEFYTPDVNH